MIKSIEIISIKNKITSTMELTFDNVYNLLESTEYTTETVKENTIRIYEKITRLLLDTFFPDYKIDDDFQVTPPTVGFKVVGPYCPAIYKDVILLEIKHFYPTVIDILNNVVGSTENKHQDIDPFDEEEWGDVPLFSQPLVWNIKEYPILFNFLLKNINLFREKSIDKRVITMIKIIINYTYGVAVYGKHFIKCYNPSLIINNVNQISENIQKEFNDYFIYADTDSYYFSDFEEALPKLTKMLEDWGFSYEIKKINYFLYIEKKRLVFSDTPFNVLGHLKVIESIKKNREKFLQRHNIKRPNVI